MELSVQSVYKYIKDGIIKVVEVPFGDERTNYVISEEAFLEAKQLFLSLEFDRVRKNEYYVSNYDIALFQYFQSPDSTAARVMKDGELNWGFYLPYYQKWVANFRSEEHELHIRPGIIGGVCLTKKVLGDTK
ncbi:hypothetical protein [Gracilibacillus dipsosauri]|uniref:hypothetical protein n=1 Tax=Gracilibacillus dipsosauri TaxID=178340 RepID=UPI00240A56C4